VDLPSANSTRTVTPETLRTRPGPFGVDTVSPSPYMSFGSRAGTTTHHGPHGVPGEHTAFTFTRLDVGRICSLYFAGLPSQHLAIGVAVMLFENVCDIEGMASVDPSYFITQCH